MYNYGSGYEIISARNEFNDSMATLKWAFGSPRFTSDDHTLAPSEVLYDTWTTLKTITDLVSVARVYKSHLNNVIELFGATDALGYELERVEKAIKLCNSTVDAFSDTFAEMFPLEKPAARPYYGWVDCADCNEEEEDE